MRAARALNINSNKKDLSPEQRAELLKTLKARFEKNMNRHKSLQWPDTQAKLEANAEKLWSLNEMERTGGEPDVVGHDKKTGEYIFYDCSAESPKGRRSVCYDREALESRKEHKPEDNAVDRQRAMVGVADCERVGRGVVEGNVVPRQVDHRGRALVSERCFESPWRGFFLQT